MFKKKHKYRAEKVDYDGHSFASKLEASVYQHLKLLEKAGEIKVLQCQDHIYLTLARIEYIPDFKCLDLKKNETFWVESKGYAAPTWPIKKKLWKWYGPGRLQIYKGHWRCPMLDEEIVPNGKAA